MSLLKLAFRGCSTCVLASVLLHCLAVAATAQTRTIELQVFADPRSQVGAQQRWMETLSQVSADRISSVSRQLSQPSIDEAEYGGSTIVTIKGVLKNNRLLLPGKSFARTEMAGIRDYLQQLRADGKRVALADKKAFGLTSEQLIDLHSKLSEKVSNPTSDRSISDVTSELMSSINVKFSIDTDVRAKLSSGDKVRNKLEGLSVGTALANVLRPLELVLAPRRKRGRAVELAIVSTGDANEFWPVGWPAETAPIELEPRLFGRRDIRIERFALDGALNAVQKLCRVPFVYDHHSIEANKIDLAQTEVTFVRKQASYMVTVGKLLNQSKPRLDYDLRIDENGTPFLWIFGK